jgi:lysophospholipase L1-like esterase
MKKKIHVIFFGDSICFGQGISLYKGWISRIAKALGEKYTNTDMDVVTTNTSVNGRTSRKALEDMPYEVQSQFPDVLLIQFGMNDCNYWETDKGLPRVSSEGFKANLAEIISRGKKSGAKKIILNTNHPTSRTTDKFIHTNITYNESNLSYNEIIRSVCKSTDDVLLNDVEYHFNKKIKEGHLISEFLLSDQLHLSEKGHDLYYEFTYPVVLSTVQELIKPNV